MPRHAPPPDLAAAEKLNPSQLFLLFSQMTLLGFGGVLPWAYRILVERRRILSKDEFRELLAFAQILPGPTICNLSVIIGHRHAGIAGSIAALAGMIAAPFALVIGFGLAYRRYGDLQSVRHALAGMSAVAAGLIVAMALKMARDLPRRLKNALLVALAFAGIALLRWPLLMVLGVLAPAALAVFWTETQR
ncbi:MAG TPA: chromate transporter [Rhodocyclaceae bacterium]|nr:chromate transporter [Rhodocyclaceae bacterium]